MEIGVCISKFSDKLGSWDQSLKLAVKAQFVKIFKMIMILKKKWYWDWRNRYLTLKVLVATIDALGHFETG